MACVEKSAELFFQLLTPLLQVDALGNIPQGWGGASPERSELDGILQSADDEVL